MSKKQFFNFNFQIFFKQKCHHMLSQNFYWYGHCNSDKYNCQPINFYLAIKNVNIMYAIHTLYIHQISYGTFKQQYVT